MDDSALTTILVAAGAGVAGVIASLSTGLRQYIEAFLAAKTQELKKKSYSHGLHIVNEFNTIISQLHALPYVDRVLTFIGQNGGGLPRPGMLYTVRSLDGWSRTNKNVFELYNFDQIVDSEYCRILEECIREGKSIITTETMPDNSILKSYYRDEGVVQSIVYYLSINNNVLTYLSIASYRAQFTPDQQVRIEMLVQRLRGLMSRM